MILSAQQKFSDAQAITATALSTNVIDLGQAGTPFGAVAPLHQDIGLGTPVPVLIQVVEDFNNATSVKVAVEVGDTEALGTELMSQTIARADLIAGKQSSMQVIPVGAKQRYIGIRYTVAGTAPSAGAITAGVSMGNQSNITGA